MNINELYNCVQNGDRRSEKQLFESLDARFRVFSRQRINDLDDIEDVVQDTLMIISREYKTMTFTVNFSAWAYKVLVNRILVYYQKKKVQTERLERIPDNESIANPNTSDTNPDFKRCLLNCMKKICGVNSRYARILNLHYHGFGTDDICKKMSITSTNYYTILSRARAMLVTCLEKGELD